ncbi:neuronal acetylcholine receptor subunit alpha-10-like [Mytilus galloprovincialis]
MFYFIFVICIYFPRINAATTLGSDIASLYKTLFETQNYMKVVRPSIDQNSSTLVTIDLHVIGINGIDELSQKLATTAYLSVHWLDQYLTWTPVSYGNANYIKVPQDDVWKPDLTLKNGFTKLTELGSSVIYVDVQSNGNVSWYPFEVFESKCEIDITYFPFDRQACDLIFVAWSTKDRSIDVKLGGKGVVLQDYADDNAEWTIISTSASQLSSDSVPKVTFTLNLQRNAGFYVTNIIVPVILLGILNFFTFVLPADSGEKMGYSITVFLAFTVFLTIVSSELPKTSGSMLGYYLIFQLGMGIFVVCATAVELRLHHKKSPVPNIIRQMVKWHCKFKGVDVCKSGNCNGNRNVVESFDKERMSEEDINWIDVTSLLDFVLFWFSFALNLIVTTTIIAILVSK